MGRHLNSLAADVQAIKANNNKMLPHGAISKLVQREKELLPWLTKTFSIT